MKRSSPARRSGRSSVDREPGQRGHADHDHDHRHDPSQQELPERHPSRGYDPAGGPMSRRRLPLLARGDVAHRVLGQRGDREARVDADVGGDRRAVADEQVLVAEGALVAVDDAGLRALADHRAAHDVRGRRDVEQLLGEAGLRGGVELLGRAAGRLVGGLDEARVRLVGILLRLQPRAGAEQVALGDQAHRVVERLHREQDHRAARPLARPQRARRACCAPCRGA